MRQCKLTSHTATSSRKSNGEANFRAEIGGQNGNGGHEKHATAKSDAKALSQHRLPELFAQTQHHEAKDHAETADEQEKSQVSAIKDGSSAGAD